MFLKEDFSDPENKEEFFSKISNISSPSEAYEFAKSLRTTDFDWIINEVDDFAEECKPLRDNWGKICEIFKQDKKKILLVKRVVMNNDSEFVIIRAISEILTRCGYCVRGPEFVGCRKCQLVYANLEDREYCKECDE